MLNSEDRKKLRSTLYGLRERLIRGFMDHAKSRYYLDMENKGERDKILRTKNREAYREWILLENKLSLRQITLEEYLKERAYTYLNRTFFLMRLESLNTNPKPLFFGMKDSVGYKEFRLFCPELTRGEDEGFLVLTKLMSEFYARELPGLFVDDSADRALGIPPRLLYGLYETWNEPEIREFFSDDTTAGWMYQYWNDPDREAINSRVRDKGKVEGSEIASATQLFTERYMVEWLVQNSLGNLWLAICAKRGVPTRATEIIATLRERRRLHNERIARRELSEDTALPLESPEEEYWKYYMERELTPEEIASAPDSIENTKLLDPACGSGHFLLYAFVFYFYLYEEEARQRAEANGSFEEPMPEIIAQKILENNLHGIDLDPRAVQIAVAVLYTTARARAKKPFVLQKLNLVASRPALGSASPPSTLEAFIRKLSEETGITLEISRALLDVLQRSDVLGSLLQIRSEIHTQLERYGMLSPTTEDEIYSKIGKFVDEHDRGNDLGLHTLGQQLGRGLRLLHLLDRKYDVVVANPPYLSSSKVGDELNLLFLNESSELYESFIYRFKELLKPFGFFSLLTAHNFLFIEKFLSLRNFILKNYTLENVVQLGVWTFKDISQPGALGFVMFILRNGIENKATLFSRLGNGNFRRDPYVKEPYLLNQPPKRMYHFQQSKFADIEGSPMIYWWTEEFREWYLGVKKLSDHAMLRQGIATSNNERFVRNFQEVKIKDINIYNTNEVNSKINYKIKWLPYLKGGGDKVWFESLKEIINFNYKDELDIFRDLVVKSTQTPDRTIFFKKLIIINIIGNNVIKFRFNKFKSVVGNATLAIHSNQPEHILIALTSIINSYISQSLNPTINNTKGDIEKLPIHDFNKDFIMYNHKLEILYDEVFRRDETNLEYCYRSEPLGEIPLFLLVGPEDFDLREIVIRAEIDREVFSGFSEETVRAIQEEVGLSAGLLPELSRATLDGLSIEGELNIESLSDIPSIDSPEMGKYFRDIYLNGPYAFAGGFVQYKINGTKERGKLQTLEGLSRELGLHPASLVALRKKFGLIRPSDRQAESFRHLGFSVGVLLGRFSAHTGGLMDLSTDFYQKTKTSPNPYSPTALSAGLYFTALSGIRNTLPSSAEIADTVVVEKIKEVLYYKWGADAGEKLFSEMEIALVKNCGTERRRDKDWVEFFRTDFFSFHLETYENRPIYFPLCSAKKNFVFYFCIHSWTPGTFSRVLSDFVGPDLRALKARLESLGTEREGQNRRLDDEILKFQELYQELEAFKLLIEKIDSIGISPERQEVRVPYNMDLDDGVMVNASALYPLLKPLWDKPEEIWKSILKPQGKKDYDWSHLAMRYFPERVLAKCRRDPSLAVAHSDYGNYAGRDLFAEFHPEAYRKWTGRDSSPVEGEGGDALFSGEGVPTQQRAKKKTATKKTSKKKMSKKK